MIQISNKTQLDKRTRRPLALKFIDLPDEAFITINLVCDVSGKRTTSIYAAIKDGQFPPPERFGNHCSRWRVGEVRRWLANPHNYNMEGKS